MPGAVPVGRLENRLSVPPQDLHQVVIHHKGVADADGDLREGNSESADEFYVRRQQIVDQRDPDLRSDGVFAGPEEALDLEILLDPFEKEFDLPAALVDGGDRRSRQREIIGNEAINIVRLLVSKLHQPEFAGKLCPGAQAMARSRISSKRASKISGERRFMASARVDFATAFIPR